MTKFRRASLWVFCCLAVSASAGFAQTDQSEPTGPPPAHLSVIDGQVYIDREGRTESAIENLPLLDGDRLRTAEGRLEVILPDGSLLHLDRETTVEVLAPDLLRLLQGRVYVIVRGARDPGLAVHYQIDSPIASVQTGGPGEFRVAEVDGPSGAEVELAVYRGQATLANDLGAQTLRAGERALVREGLAPSVPQYFNSARWDAFDRWSADRRNERLGTVSVQHLPSDLAVYASTFDRYGTWRDDPVDGAVWYPSVGDEWRPYSVGYWRSYPAWGSFWIGHDPWGWPTHHYGRWGFSAGFGWYWMPAQVWAPAWVYWAVSPGYVSWCALGRHDYPVFGHFGMRGAYYGNHVDPWRGWTVVSRQHFGSGMPVHRVAFDGHGLDDSARGAFAVQRHGPATGYAVPRRFAGGGAAAPRSDRGLAEAVPRVRANPAVASRVFGADRPEGSGAAVRRSFPTSQPPGSAGPRTGPPAATPDVTAFGNRRDGVVQRRAVPGTGSPGATVGRESWRETGQSVVPSAPRRTYDAPVQTPPRENPYLRGAGGGLPANSPRSASPRSYDAPVQTPSRENPYLRGSGGGIPANSPRSASPRSYDAPAQTPSRENPYLRGSGGGIPDGPARLRAPDRAMPPQYSQPRPPAPAWQRSSPSAQPDSSPRPRDAGSGIPSGRTYRPSGAPPSSSPGPAPRYNPGSAGSRQPAGGQSPPPPRRRGGVPD